MLRDRLQGCQVSFICIEVLDTITQKKKKKKLKLTCKISTTPTKPREKKDNYKTTKIIKNPPWILTTLHSSP